jgi:hypothetical protein
MKEKSSESQENKVAAPEKKPNENGGFYFSSHLKISDPNTKQVLVQKRGDN